MIGRDMLPAMVHSRVIGTIIFVSLLLPFRILAQLEPDTADVNLYFPQLADGGDQVQTWQTSFVFTNSNPSLPALCILSTLNDSGGPLALDLGTGLQSRQSFTIPPLGRTTLRSRMASPSVVTGWAYAACSLPVQGTVLFRQILNGVPQVEISAPASLPSVRYRSIANRSLGVALGNVFNSPITVVLRAFDAGGNNVGSRNITLCALCHTSFNLSSFSEDFPRDFEGMIEIAGSEPTTVFSAWTLNAERGLLSSLPAGGVSWPGGHEEKIWRAFRKVVAAAAQIHPEANLLATRLDIQYSSQINAFATRGDGTVHITLALAELIADSPSELASVIAHELGHIVQFKTGRLQYNDSNAELDADTAGMIFSLAAGYDPYGSAGAMGKLMMITNRTDLFSQAFDNLNDPHTSFSNRMGALFTTLQLACSSPAAQSTCAQYKNAIHPSFPPSIPLALPRPDK